jgi:uncharacterized membrane protein YhaH (DUF805 family)
VDNQYKPTNPRASRRRAQRQIFWIVIGFLVIGGTVAIALVYGPPAAALGLACLLVGAGLLSLLWLILGLLEKWAGR